MYLIVVYNRPGITPFPDSPWEETVSSKGREISWDSIGIAFSIPPGAVPKEGHLTVQPCLAGPFELPDQYQLVSPTYHVSATCAFAKDIEMVVYHSVELKSEDDCKQMVFVSAPSAPTLRKDQPRYKFTVLEGGVFDQNESFGAINLRHFCHIAICSTKPPGRLNQL